MAFGPKIKYSPCGLPQLGQRGWKSDVHLTVCPQGRRKWEARQAPPPVCTWLLQSSSLKYRVWWTWFLVFFKYEFYRLQQTEKSSSNFGKNPVHQTWNFQLENWNSSADRYRIVARFNARYLRNQLLVKRIKNPLHKQSEKLEALCASKQDVLELATLR